VLGGVGDNFLVDLVYHIVWHFPVPSMNRLNQTEPATFSILSCWAFLRDSVFSILNARVSRQTIVKKERTCKRCPQIVRSTNIWNSEEDKEFY
jgi:hypothetical protein